MAAQQPVLINGIAYSPANVTVTINGVPIAGITALSYGKKREKVNNYGFGKLPVSRSYGRVEYEGKMTLYIEEVIALRKAVATNDLLDIPPLTIVIAMIPTTGVAQIDTLLYTEFNEDMVDFSEGDLNIKVEIPLAIGSITRTLGA